MTTCADAKEQASFSSLNTPSLSDLGTVQPPCLVLSDSSKATTATTASLQTDDRKGDETPLISSTHTTHHPDAAANGSASDNVCTTATQLPSLGSEFLDVLCSREGLIALGKKTLHGFIQLRSLAIFAPSSSETFQTYRNYQLQLATLMRIWETFQFDRQKATEDLKCSGMYLGSSRTINCKALAPSVQQGFSFSTSIIQENQLRTATSASELTAAVVSESSAGTVNSQTDLSDDLNTLYESLKLTNQELVEREHFVTHLSHIILDSNGSLICKNAKLQIFGSVKSGLGVRTSDLDIALVLEDVKESLGREVHIAELQRCQKVLERLTDHGSITLVEGRIPVLRIGRTNITQEFSVDDQSSFGYGKRKASDILLAEVEPLRKQAKLADLNCSTTPQLNVSSSLRSANASSYVDVRKKGLFIPCDCDLILLEPNNHNFARARLVRSYADVDARVAPLIILVKHWAKTRGICDPTRSFLNGFSWVLMVIYYLQCISMVPQLPTDYSAESAMRNLPVSALTQMSTSISLAEALQGFFLFYSYFDASSQFVSITPRKFLTNWDFAEREHLKIIDPFDWKDNPARTTTLMSWSKIHLEIMKAHLVVSATSPSSSVVGELYSSNDDPQSEAQRIRIIFGEK